MITDNETDYGLEDVPYGPRLCGMFLHTQEWRTAFLFRLAEVGETAVIEAATRAWDLIAEPRAWRCAKMAMAAGVPGKGKHALVQILTLFIEEFIGDVSAALSTAAGHTCLDDRHNAAMAAWKFEQDRETEVVARFAGMLSDGAVEPPWPSGKLICGPWPAEAHFHLQPPANGTGDRTDKQADSSFLPSGEL